MYQRELNANWDFRTANTKEYTHCYHTYPAMMIPQVARTLIENYAPEGNLNLLFDPYMGSGTSLVEASIKGINSIGTDINPLARLLSIGKTTHFDENKIEQAIGDLWSSFVCYNEENVKDTDFSRISNYSFWYSKDVLLKLSYLDQLIQNLDTDIQIFFKIVLSEVVREVSFTRNGEFKRFRMKEDKIKKFNPDVFKLFEIKAYRNLSGLKEFNATRNNSSSKIIDINTVYEIPENCIQKESVDMIVTSPPYGDSHTTVAYGQFSRWANEWFNFENASNLDSILMGGKKQKEAIFHTTSIKEELLQIQEKDEKRYWEVIGFLNDYYNSICHVSTLVRNKGRVCYVVGNRNVKGIQIPLDYFTAEMFEKNGFVHEKTIVREIPNKRMPSKTSPSNKQGEKVSTMSNEYIVIMTKCCSSK